MFTEVDFEPAQQINGVVFQKPEQQKQSTIFLNSKLLLKCHTTGLILDQTVTVEHVTKGKYYQEETLCVS